MVTSSVIDGDGQMNVMHYLDFVSSGVGTLMRDVDIDVAYRTYRQSRRESSSCTRDSYPRPSVGAAAPAKPAVSNACAKGAPSSTRLVRVVICH